MKNKLSILGILLMASSAFAQTKEINFEKTSFADIKAKAKKENKLIFIDAYTTWCGPCKWMAANVFTNDTVADYFNTKFVNAKIDMEKGEGPEIGKLYDVRCYPNLLIIDGDGKLVHRAAGAKPTKEFIEFAENSFNPEKRFSKYTSEYESKKADAAFLLNYLAVLGPNCMPAEDVLKDYFATQKEENLSNRQNWTVIKNYVTDHKSKEFNYLLKNIDKFRRLYTSDSVDSQIETVLATYGYAVIYNKNSTEKDYIALDADIQAIMEPHGFKGTDKVLFTLDMAAAEKIADWKKYATLFVEKGELYLKEPQEINNVSWNIYEHSDDKNALLKAEYLMGKAVKDIEEWYAYDTYAAILYKLKKKKEAKFAAERAIEMAKKQGAEKDEYKGTLELLKKIDKL